MQLTAAALNIRLARAGVGLSLADDRTRDEVSRGELIPVIEEFSTKKNHH